MKKMGRPKKAKDKMLDYVLNLRFNNKQKQQLWFGWEKSGIATLSEYCRIKLFKGGN